MHGLVTWEGFLVLADQVFDEDEYYTGPPVTAEMVTTAERALGVRLPSAYVSLIVSRNGGSLRRRCFPTAFPTSWAPDHIGVDAILGVGWDWGLDSDDLGSRYMVAEWGYPDVGVVICAMPSGGHDAVMLDYRRWGPDGEPVVVYVDEDRVPRQIAESFDDFLQRLTECPAAGQGQVLRSPDAFNESETLVKGVVGGLKVR